MFPSLVCLPKFVEFSIEQEESKLGDINGGGGGGSHDMPQNAFTGKKGMGREEGGALVHGFGS